MKNMCLVFLLFMVNADKKMYVQFNGLKHVYIMYLCYCISPSSSALGLESNERFVF